MEMAGLKKSTSNTKTTSYTVKHVQRRPGGPARRPKNIGNAAAARGWDDVAEAKSQALGGGDGDEENNSPLGSGEKNQPGSFDFDSWGN